MESFEVGNLYTNEEIFKTLQVSNAGGVRPSVKDRVVKRLVIMTSLADTKIKQENPYHDRLEKDTLTYTAEGKLGDQTLSGKNRRIPDQADLDYPIHGFIQVASRRDRKFGPRRWKYLGLLEYLRYYPEHQLGTDQQLRQVWMFEFKVHQTVPTVPVRYDHQTSVELLKESRTRSLLNDDDRQIDREECVEGDEEQKKEFAALETLRGKLLNVSPQRFEVVISELLRHTGFEKVHVTQYSQDGGVDVNAMAGSTMWPLKNTLIQVQAKRWQHSVGRPEVAEFRGSLQPFASGTIVTTSHFTKAAIREANESGKKPITLINGFELSKIMLDSRFFWEET